MTGQDIQSRALQGFLFRILAKYGPPRGRSLRPTDIRRPCRPGHSAALFSIFWTIGFHILIGLLSSLLGIYSASSLTVIIMTNRGRGKTTRSQGRGRPYNRELRSAAPNSHHTSSPSRHETLSPARDGQFPAGINKASLVSPQSSGRSSSLQSTIEKAPDLQHVDPRSTDPDETPSNLSSSPMIVDDGDETSEVSDNAINNSYGTEETPPPPPPPNNGALSLELVLSELRDIKQQMSELKGIKRQISKIESATGSVDEKLTGVMNRTSELETAVMTISSINWWRSVCHIQGSAG